MSIPAHESPKETQVTTDPPPVDAQTTDKGGRATDQLEQMQKLMVMLPDVRVFACKPGDKKPVGRWKDDNTDDPARMRQYFVR